MPTINIDPTNPSKTELKILAKLLDKFKNNENETVLRKNRKNLLINRKENRPYIHEVTYEGKVYKIKLKHSISKISSPDDSHPEFYIRTKEKLGSGGYGTVKRAAYRLRLDEQGVFVFPGIMIYKRLKFEEYSKSRERQPTQKKLEEFKKLAASEVAMVNKRYGLNVQLIEKKTNELIKYSIHFFIPFIPGQTLDKVNWQGHHYITTKSLNMKKRIACTRQLFRDLDFIHSSKGIAHLDVKPANILLTKHGQLRCIDFGFTRYPSDVLTQLPGSPGYVAPEIVTNKSKDHRQADMYSSALTFYGIITGYDGIDRAGICGLHYNGRRYKGSTLYPKTAKLDFDKSTPDKKLAAIFSHLFVNLSEKDPDKRFNAGQAEMLVSIISSQLFGNYLKNQKDHFDFNESLKQNVKQYSLQDLFYMLNFNMDIKGFERTLGLIFDGDDEKIKKFRAALIENQTSIQNAYSEKLSQQLINLRKTFGKRSEENNVSDLITFIQTNQEYHFDTLVDKLEKTLMHLIDAHYDKRTKKTGPRYDIDKILALDPFILEQISPGVLEKAYELRPSKFARMFKQIFAGQVKQTTLPDNVSVYKKNGSRGS